MVSLTISCGRIRTGTQAPTFVNRTIPDFAGILRTRTETRKQRQGGLYVFGPLALQRFLRANEKEHHVTTVVRAHEVCDVGTTFRSAVV